ncbi:DUF1810 domain-containing protein [Stutzerimonas stutzeri]|uniref:DUF1810 domain-containing protein n=1 Tax=Stutzerimonas stutzeri TaxID=316 RepID=UPI0015E3BE5D|nr:DUF1810 domain-containing protein [Stutzerimonas stutzeri]MBA1227400.1 DUF1810 domain-containing protein [Stutzerimonas stutzeri]MCP3433762.1 DUF1810 domain-containing protein [Stutzerimonas stutzeri]MCQ4226154.1 DUF1810 domain-containing protein [Stutzerimonas stutzeri]MDH0443818.1 DUF1810 domain-containing protein [Stutzerimonas stutzeri]MDH1555635.1 DUF1810 domain-containing protein [Stutzerimonas stutzeri]
MNDPFDLQRFVDAQRDHYEQALQELRAGRKRTHWMWYVFPQLHGLGRSAMAQRYAISGRDEALAYLQHPLLGPRLQACTQAMLEHRATSAHRILGSPDDLKFHSCMTLFARTAQQPALFEDALQAFFDGQPDRATLERLDGC